MTQQEALDKIWQYFIIDKHAPGYDPMERKCVYNVGGNKCAVGCLIPEDLLSEVVENSLLTNLDSRILKALGDSETINFLTDVQIRHDEYAADAFDKHNTDLFYTKFETSLRALADKLGLKVPA